MYLKEKMKNVIMKRKKAFCKFSFLLLGVLMLIKNFYGQQLLAMIPADQSSAQAQQEWTLLPINDNELSRKELFLRYVWFNREYAFSSILFEESENPQALQELLCYQESTGAQLTPLLICIAAHYETSTRLLLDYVRPHQQILEKIFTQKTAQGLSPLMMATVNNDPRIITILLQTLALLPALQKKVLFEQNTQGLTPLLLAATKGNEEGAIAILRVISTNKTLLKELLFQQTPSLLTLFEIAEKNNLNELKELILTLQNS